MACSSTPPNPDGGPPRVLEIVDPNPPQLGLQFGMRQGLTVRYRLDDANQTPLSGQTIGFAIFGDPGGSTLSTDHATSDSDGNAKVQLTTGTQEATFSVRATADGAMPVEFDVAVSANGFVDIAVKLSWTDAASPVTAFNAALYIDHTCAQLPPSLSPPPPLRQFPATAVNGAGTILFQNLLSRGYALLARATDGAGHLVAQGCLDLGAAQLPPTVSLTVVVPLTAVQPDLTGDYALSTALTTPKALTDARTAAWLPLACSAGLAQELLDGINVRVSGSLSTAIGSHRGAADAMGCRPNTQLDGQLQTALGSQAQNAPTLVANLQALLAAATLTSTLSLQGYPTSDGTTYEASHALVGIALSVGGAPLVFDYVQAGFPDNVADHIPAGWSGGQLTLGEHALGLALGPLWGRGFAALSLQPLSSTDTPSAWVTAAVAAASSGGKTGCDAVEEVVCTTVGSSGCTGVIAPACTATVTALGASLDASFAPTGGDVLFSGHATTIDSDGDLRIDTLKPGLFSTDLLGDAPFSGMRQ
jgi:hypothetical protein